MKAEGPERRLAAIVAIDVVGYSRLMGADEEGTLATLKSHQDAVTPLVQDHGGRLVGTAGDGLLLEYPSVVEALNSSIKVQALMAERNTDIADDKKMLFRIGINLGDIIIHTDNDVFGDGVNVAARIEQLAKAGGICISRSVRNQVRDKMDVNLEDMGEIEVKNIARPIRVFRVLKDGEVAAKPPRKTSAWQKYAAMVVLVFTLIGGAVAWWWGSAGVQVVKDDYEFSIRDKPSIAVLPFDNLTNDPSLQYLCDGLTENIIAVLAGTPEMFVIARNSVFSPANEGLSIPEIAKRLNVRYVLEGSVQKDGDKLRITAQLIDAKDDLHLWAERYDVEMKGIFELQDVIALKISNQMEVNLTIGKQAALWQEASETPEIYDLLMRGRVRYQTFSPEGNKDAETLWQRLFELSKNKTAAKSLLSYIYLQKIWIGISEDQKADLAKAKQYAGEALAEDPEDSFHHITMSWVNRMEGKWDAAIKNIDHALKLSPGLADTTLLGGSLKIFAGQPEEGVPLLEKGIRLEPDYPHYVIYSLANGYRMLGNYERSKTISKASLEKKSDDIQVRQRAFVNLAVISQLEGEGELAKSYVKQLRTEYPTFRLSSYASRMRTSYRDQDFANRSIDALRQAGLPD